METSTTLIGNRTAIHYSPLDGSHKESWQWVWRQMTTRSTNDLRSWCTATKPIGMSGWDPCYYFSSSHSEDCVMGLNGTELTSLNSEAWWANDDGPVFQKSDETVGVGPFDAVAIESVPAWIVIAWRSVHRIPWGRLTNRRAEAPGNRVPVPVFSPPVIIRTQLKQSKPRLRLETWKGPKYCCIAKTNIASSVSYLASTKRRRQDSKFTIYQGNQNDYG
ncbi:hypothetical protein BDZ89DRAFT_1218292 [Hymenopellis radicata]|nr:hypothetical protein BDZ89DRAFT_1218292 [Hymenopellis radicata]